jgi:NADPH:quinone reductase-like Zn-dependent oxidoreductase
MQRGLAPLLARGQVTPHVSGVYRLEDAPDAYRAIEARGVVGKLVLEVA